MTSLDLDGRREVLRHSALFTGLDASVLDNVLARAVMRRATAGEALLTRGQPGAGVFIVISGRVRIGVVTEDGREVVLGLLGPGDVLGEMSVLDGQDVSADAAAIEDCVLLFLERSRFLGALRENGELCLRLMAMLAGRIRKANAVLEDMTVLDLPGRLARLVLRLSRDYGTRTARGTRIQVKLSQKDVGTMIGASREKVNRQLRQWEQDGILGRDSGHMVVLEMDALLKLLRS